MYEREQKKKKRLKKGGKDYIKGKRKDKKKITKQDKRKV